MILVEPDRLGGEREYGVELATDLGAEREVAWSFESEKAPRQKFGVRERTARPAPRRVPLPPPLEQLLACRREQIPDRGMRALQWLRGRSWISRNRTLERLAIRVAQARREDDKAGKEQNCIAALELLVSFQSSAATTLLENWFRSRPVAQGHLYLVSMLRLLCLSGTPGADRFADLIVTAFEEVMEHGQLDTEWGRRFCVEAFRSLGVISPGKVVGPVCRHLAVVGSLELSAVLEAVLQALRSPGVFPTRVLTDMAERLWKRYLSEEVERADNVPGVLARLLEILVRSGQPVDDKLQALQAHRLRASILYLATQQGLDYLSRQDRKRYFLEVLRALKGSGQTISYRRLLQSIPPDLGISEGDLQ
jgi:hypothetical protein